MTTGDQITSSKKIELTLPTINVDAIIKKAKNLFSNIYRPISDTTAKTSESVKSSSRRFRLPNNLKDKFKFDKSNLKFILPVVIGLFVVVGIVSIVRSLPNAESRPEESTNASQDALATINLNRKFDFPIENEKGEEVGSFEYVIQSAQLQEQIVVKGQRANAISGRVFLILNLKITNSQKQTISLNTKDYLRVVVASNPNEQLAPDIHNDPVEVQAISTKYTRVGIAINEEDAKKTIHLKVGQIDGEKVNIDLDFKY